MIIDLERFIAEEKPYWDELQSFLDRFEGDLGASLELDGVKRFHYLYQRASSDLARLGSCAAYPELLQYLENLVARSFGEIHASRGAHYRFAPRAWISATFPRAFRRHIRAFRLALLVTVVGALFGGAVIVMDPSDKDAIFPFEHLAGSPAERVAKEEQQVNRELESHKLAFSSQLMTHNTQVAVGCLALGITFGVGTLLMLFYNGVVLGAVVVDYVVAGKSAFLAGWLLPHGVIEIPAILIAGEAGFVLAAALMGRESGYPLRERMRLAMPDIVTLIGGVALMLVWAGLIEALFSQYHEPVLPYALKTGFGLIELVALVIYLSRGGAVTEAGAKGRVAAEAGADAKGGVAAQARSGTKGRVAAQTGAKGGAHG